MNQQFKKSVLLTLLVMMLCTSLMSQIRLKDRYIRAEQQNYTSILVDFEKIGLEEVKTEQELFNYYLAYLFANYSDRNKAAKIKKRENILLQLKNIAAPDNFEVNFIDYLHNGYNELGIASLKKAYAIDPTRDETWDDLLGYYEIIGDREKAKTMAEKIKSNGKYEESIFQYNINVLASTSGPAIIFTQGEIDTYPLLALKYINTHNDVFPVSLKLLQNDSYRENFLSQIGSTNIAFQPNSPENFMEKIAKQNPTYKLYASMTLKRNILASIKNKLYLTGLVFQYSTAPISNIQLCLDNFSSIRFSKNYFFNKRVKSAESNDLHRNYLPFLGILENHKSQLSEDDYAKVKSIKENILNRIR